MPLRIKNAGGRDFRLYNQFYPAKCGHQTTLRGVLKRGREKREITIFPRKSAFIFPHEEGSGSSEEIDYCLKCLEKMAIGCACCGKAIFPGDPISLFRPKGAKIWRIIRRNCGVKKSSEIIPAVWLEPGKVHELKLGGGDKH